MDRSETAQSSSRAGLEWRATLTQAIARDCANETAIGISLDGRPHAVLMASPGDLEDLARGFVLTEGLAEPQEVVAVHVATTELGPVVDVRLSPGRRRPRPRALEARSSCGLCGVQRLADAMRALPVVTSRRRFGHDAVHSAVRALDGAQPLGRRTRATHAAAFATSSGSLALVREDVGRHNALDKLAGAIVRYGRDPADGFVVVTSRCSFEMVEKTARLGTSMIVAISAPTDLAIRKAEEAALTLVALARADGHTVFSHPERLSGVTERA